MRSVVMCYTQMKKAGAGKCYFFEHGHDLPHRSHSRRLSLSQDYSSADSLLCGVSRRKNDTQSFLLARRLFALRSQSDLGLITSKLVEYRLTTAAKKKELDTPNGVPSSFELCFLNLGSIYVPHTQPKKFLDGGRKVKSEKWRGKKYPRNKSEEFFWLRGWDL